MQIGRFETNKIYNEDSYKAIKDLPDKCIDLIVTDPPYLIKNTTAGGNSNLARSIQGMNNEIKDNKITDSIDIKILDEFVRVMKKVNIYIWCNKEQIPMYLDFFVIKNNCNFEIIIWKKTNAMPLFNNKYLSDKEFCLYFRRGGYCNPANYENAKTLWEMPINMKDKNLFDHPTIKPLEIIRVIIENSSNENDIVADFFLGSGTTAVACKDLNRQYIGFEIDKKWYDIAKDRLNNIDASGQISLLMR